MGKTRIQLQTYLELLKGDRNVYFQPPPSFKMSYPAIVYNLASLNSVHADDIRYIKHTCYKMIYITKNPDDPMVGTLNELPYCTFENWYVSDNLNHYVYTLFY